MKALPISLERGGKHVSTSRRHSVTGCITGGRPLGPGVRRHSVSGCRLLPYHPKASLLEETPFPRKFPSLSKIWLHGANNSIRVLLGQGEYACLLSMFDPADWEYPRYI